MESRPEVGTLVDIQYIGWTGIGVIVTVYPGYDADRRCYGDRVGSASILMLTGLREGHRGVFTINEFICLNPTSEATREMLKHLYAT